MAVSIRELNTDAEVAAIWPLIRQLNPDMNKKTFTTRLRTMRAQGYRCIAAFDGKAMLGISGFWVGTRFWCGTYLDMDNVVVDAKHRGKGIGEKMAKWIDGEAARLGCEYAVLDSYVTYHDAHRFYFHQGYKILGYHFTKKLK